MKPSPVQAPYAEDLKQEARDLIAHIRRNLPPGAIPIRDPAYRLALGLLNCLENGA